jgi:hypothetical protein
VNVLKAKKVESHYQKKRQNPVPSSLTTTITNMNHINWIRVLLLGIIGLTSLATTDAATVWPEEVSEDVLRNGCPPFARGVCPAKMFCWVDFKYKKYGQCQCRGDYMLKRLPPTQLEPGSELAFRPRRTDCVNVGLINIPASFGYLVLLVVYAIIFCTSISMLHQVIKNGGFKPNSSCIALVAIIPSVFASFWKYFIFGINRIGWDPYWHWYGPWYVPLDFFDAFFNKIVMLECFGTWFDIWQKSMTMSKRSSSLVTVIRIILRTFLVVVTSLMLANYYQWLPSSGVAFQQSLLDFTMNSILFVSVVVGPLLARMLCKDYRDVTNPNWKAASAILHVGLASAISTFGFNQGFKSWVKYAIFTNQAQHNGAPMIFFQTLCHCVFLWHWFQYLQFAHRRYLGDVSSSRITQYFGFTTIGGKGSRASMASGKSTTTSSTSSIAATSSTEGGTETTDGKGTMA